MSVESILCTRLKVFTFGGDFQESRQDAETEFALTGPKELSTGQTFADAQAAGGASNLRNSLSTWSVHSTVLLQFVRCRSNLAATADLAPPRMRTQMPQIPCTLSTMMDTDSYAEDTDWQFVAI